MRNISTPFSPLKCEYLGIFEKEPPRGSFPIFYPLYLQSCLRCTECFLGHYLMTLLNQSQDKILLLTLFNQETLKMEKERDLPNIKGSVCEKQSRAQAPYVSVEHAPLHTVLSMFTIAISNYSLLAANWIFISNTLNFYTLGFLCYLLLF